MSCDNRLRRAMVVAVLVAVALLAPAPGGTADLRTAFEPPTMLAMNSPFARSRIEKGFFSPVYRGFGQRTAAAIAVNEVLGFRFLLDADCQSLALRELVQANVASGCAPAEALRRARVAHVGMLQREFRDMAALANLYENHPRKDEAPERHFLFTTPHRLIACSYGPVVLTIEETRPRGLDLNGCARDARYYTVARVLQNLANLRWHSIVADYVADRDEYVIPSYIPACDITGMIVHEPSPVVIAKKLAVPPPRIMRIYRRRFVAGAAVIDVLDGRERLIARLSAVPSRSTPEPGELRSDQSLPPGVAAAWAGYLATRRRPAKPRPGPAAR